MDKVYDWMAKHPEAARIGIVAIVTAMVAILTVPAVLYIPGFLDNIKMLHRQNPVLFFAFVVTPGVITTTCAWLWAIGTAWDDLGDALGIGKDKGNEEAAD